MEKQKLYAIIDEKAPLLTALSDKIWEYAELSMLEFKSTAAYVQILKEEGFDVTENLCGIATAFSGSYGSGKTGQAGTGYNYIVFFHSEQLLIV